MRGQAMALRQEPRHKDFGRAWRAQAERRFDAAVDLWEAYAERYPDDASAGANLVICLINSGEPREALVAARRVRGLSDGQGGRLTFLQALRANGLVEELEREAAGYVECYPADPVGMSLWGEAAYLRGNLEAAEERLLRALGLDPRGGGCWAALGRVRMERGRYERALEAWGGALAHAAARPLRRDEARFDALMGMGWSLLLMEKPDRGLVLAEQAEGLNVGPPAAEGLRARCLLTMRYPSGLSVAEDAFRNGYADDYLRALTAFEYAMLGRRDASESHLGKMGPHPSIFARNLRAGALSALGRADEALLELEDLDGELEPYVRLNGLATAHRAADDHERAEKMSLKALEIRRDEIILTNLASQYIDGGRYDEAELLLEESIRLAPDFADARLMLGFAYAYNGKPGRSKDHLRAVLSSELARETHKSDAAELLGKIGRGEQISAGFAEQGLALYHYAELQRTLERARRQDTLRYEEECGRLAATRRGKLRWSGVGTGRKKTHHGRKKEVDVLGLVETEGRRRVGVGECKLKTGGGVSYGEMRGLVEKMALVLCEERHGEGRGVDGCFFSASGYEEDALELAGKHDIRTFLAVPQKGWEKRADWKIGRFEEVFPASVDRKGV